MSQLPLHFYELSFLPEGDNVLVGRPGAASYAVLPVDGAALLQRMASGASPADAAEWYQATYGDPVDIDDFVQAIAGLGFVGVEDAEEPEVGLQPVGLQRFAGLLFSHAAFVGYAAIVATWLWIIVRDPRLAPRPSQVFFTHYLVPVQLLLLFGQLPLLFLHEYFHVLAGRRLGLPSRIRLGRRAWVIVVETQMPDLLAVARSRRYLPFLAGMLADVLVVSGLGLLAAALGGGEQGRNGEPLLAGIALALAFPVAMRFAYQFLLFLQTDVYFVISTALGCYDLHAASRTLLANRFWHLARRPQMIRDEEQWTPRDRRVARWYAPLFALGAIVLLALTVGAVVPVIIDCVHLAARAVASRSHGTHFWDAVVFIAMTVAQFGVYLFLLARRRDHRPSADPAVSPATS